jgi:hypothetical protein
MAIQGAAAPRQRLLQTCPLSILAREAFGMDKDDRQKDSPASVEGSREPQRSARPAPGKVTRTSKLPGGGGAVQRKAADAAPAAAPSPARSAWDHTMDPSMDASHRGLTALAERGQGATGGTVYRDAAGSGAVDGAMVGSVVQKASESSAGRALDPGVRGEMESGFGADLSGVRVHTDAAAGSAASALNARAFTTGSDVYFGSGQYDAGSTSGKTLLAHELAHTLQGGGPAAKGTGSGWSVSSPGDPAEQAADRAAEAVVAGRPAPALGSGAASVHRDAMGDLNESLGGNWLGQVDGAEVVRRFEALSAAERENIVRNDHATMRRVVQSLNAFQMTQVYVLLPRAALDLRWKVYWLIIGGQIEGMSLQQWRWIAVYNGPDDWTALRAYPDGYRAVLQHCPPELITPWDLLEGVKNGMFTGAAVHIRTAASNLNPTQRANVRADNAKMSAIVTRCGDAHEAFRTLRYLGATIADTCAFLNQANHLPSLDAGEWGQLFGEASRTEVDDMVTNRAPLWAVVQTHCPAGIIAAARGATQQVPTTADPTVTEANVNNQLSDPVQLQAMLTTMGAAGFLGLCCATGANVAANYTAVKTANKVTDVVNGLQPGFRMGERTMANLRQWFMLEAATPALAQLMFEKRFDVAAGGSGAYTHSATLVPWTIPAMQQMWPVLERLPPSNVEGNRRLVNILASNAGSGSAYYGYLISDPNFLSGDVVMGGQGNLGDNRTDGAFGPSVFSANGRGAGTGAINMNVFNSTLRHEIGHAVDRQLGIMDTWGAQDSAGGWITYPSPTAFVDALIAAGGGLGTASAPLHGYPAADVALYRQAMINAVTNNQAFQVALAALKPTAAAAPDAGPVSALFARNRFTGNGDGPWYNPGNWKPQGGRNFQKAYPTDPASLYSFKDAIRVSRGVTQYQWRAPGEWFAEVYQVYYAEQENAPDAPVGGILRSRDQYAAEMMTTIVDRGHSPQEMRGGTISNAPGT